MSDSLPHQHIWKLGKFHKFCIYAKCCTIKDTETGIIQDIPFYQWEENRL